MNRKQITATVKDSDLRSFLTDLRRQGAFVVRSSICGSGYTVTYVL